MRLLSPNPKPLTLKLQSSRQVQASRAKLEVAAFLGLKFQKPICSDFLTAVILGSKQENPKPLETLNPKTLHPKA